MVRYRGIPLVLAALLSVSGALQAQSIVGRVVDARSGVGLSNGTVVLVGLDLREISRTLTDSQGRYVVATGRPGTFYLSFERPGLASKLSGPVRLVGSELYEHLMEVPTIVIEEQVRAMDAGLGLAPEVVLRTCGERMNPSSQGIIVGKVVDSTTGLGLPSVWAVAEWDVDALPGRLASPADLARVEAVTEEGGAFAICGLPAGKAVVLWAAGPADDGPRVAVQVEPGMLHRADLALRIDRSGEPGNLIGRVTDQATGAPVEAAEVRLLEAGVYALTDRNGHFAIDGVEPGAQRIRVGHVAYAGREVTLVIRSGVAQEVEVNLTQEAIPLDPIVVTVRSRRWFLDMRGFQHRMRVGVGHFFTGDDLERRRPGRLLDLIYGIPGLSVRRSGGAYSGSVSFASTRGMCSPVVYVDRSRWRGGGGSPLLTIAGSDLEAVEVYRSGLQAPLGFNSDPRCAAIVVWTRRGAA